MFKYHRIHEIGECENFFSKKIRNSLINEKWPMKNEIRAPKTKYDRYAYEYEVERFLLGL